MGKGLSLGRNVIQPLGYAMYSRPITTESKLSCSSHHQSNNTWLACFLSVCFCCRMTGYLRTRGDTTLCAVVWHCTLWGFNSLCWTGYDIIQVSIWRAGSICCHETMGLQHSPHADVRVRRQPRRVAPHLSRVVIFGDSASTALQQVTCIQER